MSVLGVIPQIHVVRPREIRGKNDWQLRKLVGIVEARWVNVKNTQTQTCVCVCYGPSVLPLFI